LSKAKASGTSRKVQMQKLFRTIFIMFFSYFR
jgi:hypothetical protein